MSATEFIGWSAACCVAFGVLMYLLGHRAADYAWILRTSDQGYGRCAYFCRGQFYCVMKEADFLVEFKPRPKEERAEMRRLMAEGLAPVGQGCAAGDDGPGVRVIAGDAPVHSPHRDTWRE